VIKYKDYIGSFYFLFVMKNHRNCLFHPYEKNKTKQNKTKTNLNKQKISIPLWFYRELLSKANGDPKTGEKNQVFISPFLIDISNIWDFVLSKEKGFILFTVFGGKNSEMRWSHLFRLGWREAERKCHLQKRAMCVRWNHSVTTHFFESV
jgi:hypothetical protein